MHVSEGRDGGGEGESLVSNQRFLVVVPTTISFCILKKQANHSTCFIFSVLNTSLSAETLPGKVQLPFFSLFTAAMPKQTADKNAAQSRQLIDSKTRATDFQRGIWDKHLCIVKSFSRVHHNTVM